MGATLVRRRFARRRLCECVAFLNEHQRLTSRQAFAYAHYGALYRAISAGLGAVTSQATQATIEAAAEVRSSRLFFGTR